MSYVKEQEAKLKAEYWANLAWIRFVGLWREIGQAMCLQRDIDYLQDKQRKLRAQYVKRGRKAVA